MTFHSDNQLIMNNISIKKETKKKLLTPQERFIKMYKKNKELLKLKKEFNLDFI